MTPTQYKLLMAFKWAALLFGALMALGGGVCGGVFTVTLVGDGSARSDPGAILLILGLSAIPVASGIALFLVMRNSIRSQREESRRE